MDHFIDYLKDDVRIVKDIPDWFTDKTELFSSIRFASSTLYLFSDYILCLNIFKSELVGLWRHLIY